MTKEKATVIVNDIFLLYENWGAEDYVGEPVSQIEHMCQAAELAEAEGYNDEVILAAFFHDIGHLVEYILPVKKMKGLGVLNHEKIGSEYLREKGFSKIVCSLVQSHVQAKRYLTYKYPEYYEKLSPASRLTLIHQGGIMNETEAAIFEVDNLRHLYIKLREWDDLAKEIHRPLPLLDKYKQLTLSHLMKSIEGDNISNSH